MGIRSKAFCLDCAHEFFADQFGGFSFELTRCTDCGKTKGVPRGKVKKGSFGKCSCGGSFTLDAPIRCPVCHSARVQLSEPVMHYD
jgi:hypothetical protein